MDTQSHDPFDDLIPATIISPPPSPCSEDDLTSAEPSNEASASLHESSNTIFEDIIIEIGENQETLENDQNSNNSS